MPKNAAALEEIRSVMGGSDTREERAERVAEVIRGAGSYRWVGLYDVDREEIRIIAWTGPNAPAYLRFPRTQGLCGAAVRSGSTVMLGDVTKDPRYLTTFGNSRSEIVVPVLHPATRSVIGVIDVESDRENAFSEKDRDFLEQCASLLLALWQ